MIRIAGTAFAPSTKEARPLLVGLHSWSSDYRQANTSGKWAVNHDGTSFTPTSVGVIVRRRQWARSLQYRIFSVLFRGLGSRER